MRSLPITVHEADAPAGDEGVSLIAWAEDATEDDYIRGDYQLNRQIRKLRLRLDDTTRGIRTGSEVVLRSGSRWTIDRILPAKRMLDITMERVA